MSNFKLFGLTFVCTITVVVGYFYLDHRRQVSQQPTLTQLTDQVFLTAQLKPGNMRSLSQRQIKTVIDMRPDGEAADQPTSEQMQRTARAMNMEFHYIPVPHESIPDEAVDSLHAVLKDNQEPMVLYCRTGRRAARLYALAEASLSGGPNADDILARVRAAGFDAEDLARDITRRIASRGKTQPGAKP